MRVDPFAHFPKRRRVKWPATPAAGKIEQTRPASEESMALLGALEALPQKGSARELLHAAVEALRDLIGLERVGIMLCDWESGRMRGTFGCDAEGRTQEEFETSYVMGEYDRQVFDAARSGREFWTVLEHCPNISSRPGLVTVLRVSWGAQTPLLGPEGPIGMMFNDAAISGDGYDADKQARAAVFCRHLALLLGPRPRLVDPNATKLQKPDAAVARALELLRQDPTLDGEVLARRLRLSKNHLLRAIKAKTGSSFIEHRNRLRLARFMELTRERPDQLLDAALTAGFGSYAQFHRVFSAKYGCAPKEFFAQHVTPSAPP